jgi:hypothetical protein
MQQQAQALAADEGGWHVEQQQLRVARRRMYDGLGGAPYYPGVVRSQASLPGDAVPSQG